MTTTNQPIISFIIPIYNVEEYLHDCLNSLLAQNISKEIILIDDGSCDGSLKIALDYAAKYPFITVVHNQNQGQSTARNRGIRLAQGNYLFFVDSDDIVLGDYLPNIVAIAQYYQADLIRVNAEISFLNGQRFPIPTLTQDSDSQTVYSWSAIEAFSATVERGWIPGICWTLIRRHFLQKIELMFHEGITAEDQLFYIQLLTSAPEAKLLEFPMTLYRYQRRANSTVTSPTKHYFTSHYKVIKLIHEYARRNKSIEHTQMSKNLSVIFDQLRNSAYRILTGLPQEEQQSAYNEWTTELKEIFEFYDIPL